MDAQAYLIKHGWSGPGNPLNPNKRPGAHSGLGLTRPLLVSRKANNHGVGKKTTKDPTNQWWLRGFEDALKGVGDNSFEANSARENNALTSELYRHFVRGEGLAGTLEGTDKKKEDESGTSTSKSESKRKREDGDEGDRKARKLAKAARKVEKAERKEARRVKRAAKAERREKKIAGKLAKKALREKKKTASEEDYPTPTSMDLESDQTAADMTETDEAVARLKEAAKKEKKESKKAKSIGGDEDPKKRSKKERKDKKEAKA
ncbi:hypothetical protein E8E15_003937 [Penicillium rubens]|jgi:nucleolar protein TMA23|uniref:Pc16g14040 protein n=2 Tax=Penicillium chrysogenum species complex TaxID=254878 RepID=B6H9V1_PENRW|nr:uncharacterized protein N7525_010419 [Penicillium rubens]KZN93390.1 hypothetical protein EN45_035640 [Penicillium chrysogenum]CAP94074.1 Pc16g14040 [Penicillium rubens Wisconsin 54-1255]KAF3021204.1 hypothetical protein E8E15_003937 [Penicillium rubens]KAJ5036112.1 hypothetical protein NUH16_003980 [Penicillium rubens]KAJ5821135.1 hypothetical protein N7525_010419 [Penicillium rubens]